MAQSEHLNILKKGPQVWNEWRERSQSEVKTPDLTKADLSGLTLTGMNLINCNFEEAILNGTQFQGSSCQFSNFKNVHGLFSNFSYSHLSGSNFRKSKFECANFSHALMSGEFDSLDMTSASFIKCIFYRTDLSWTCLADSDLSGSYLQEANLRSTILTNCILKETKLDGAILVDTILNGANLNDSSVYGISAWNCSLNGAKQKNLSINSLDKYPITVDNIELAQFIFLLLKNENLRNIIDVVASKTVLILGRFTSDRKKILDSIREKLRELNLTPILFDFETPYSKDLTSTIETLARLVKFIIVDLTDPQSVPHELASIIPFLRTTPIIPIIEKTRQPYGMFKDFQNAYKWVLETYVYEDEASLVAQIPKLIIPAIKISEELSSKSK